MAAYRSVDDGAVAKVAGASPFDTLLRQLQAQHYEEVGQLRAEVATLKAAAEAASPPPVAKPDAAVSAAEPDAAVAAADPPLDPSATPPFELSVSSDGTAARADEAIESLSVGSTGLGDANAAAELHAAVAAAEAPFDPSTTPPLERFDSSGGAAARVDEAIKAPSALSIGSTGSLRSRPQLSRTESAARLSSYIRHEERDKGWVPWLRNTLLGPGELFFSGAIVVNVVVSFVLFEIRGRQSGAKLGVASSGATAATLERLTQATLAFTVLFALEQVLKFSLLGRSLFRIGGRVQWFNVFDATIVVLSVLDEFLLVSVNGGVKLSAVRSFRIIRVLRVLRVARSLSVFSSLRMLVSAVFASVAALFWSMVLLGIVLLTSALCMCQAVYYVIEDPAFDFELRAWAYRYYGTSSRAVWTFFELTFSGGWPSYARPLVEKASLGFGVFFALYIAVVTFAMFRVISALFLKDTLKVASLDVDNTIQEKLAEKEVYTQKLADFFAAADMSGDGSLTLAEFDEILECKHLMAYLATLELDPGKARDLFLLLDKGDGTVSIDDFVKGAIQFKGAARSQDLAILSQDVSRVRSKLDTIESALVWIQQSLRPTYPASPCHLARWPDVKVEEL